MNTKSARKAMEFAKIVREDPTGTVVRVPGHGKTYFVKVQVEGRRVTTTCRSGAGQNCLGNSNGSICYHSLAAVATVLEDAAWCECLSDALDRANIGGVVYSIVSTQGRGQIWAVAPEQVDVTLEKARRYVELLPAYYADPRLAVEDEEFKDLDRFFAVRNWSEGTVRRYVAEHDPKAVLARGRAILRGKEEVEL